MWISRKRWQIGHTFVLSTNCKSHTAFPLTYLHVISAHSKGQGQGYEHSLAYLELTVTYSKRPLGCFNGVSPNILASMLTHCRKLISKASGSRGTILRNTVLLIDDKIFVWFKYRSVFLLFHVEKKSCILYECPNALSYMITMKLADNERISERITTKFRLYVISFPSFHHY